MPRWTTKMTINDLLETARTIAVVGLSPKTDRPSNGVTRYMQRQGYRIIPVNPGFAEILGEKSYKTLEDIPEPVDIVNIFRESSAVPEIVEQAIRINAKAIWMQQGITHDQAAQRAEEMGLFVVQDSCIFQEHARLPLK